jgi:alginate O-acetyltransferase complex protein AlgI
VSGLWHGAGWNFVVWGAWHGACLCVHRLFRTFRTAPEVPGTFGNVLSWMVTFSAVTLGWAFFCMDINTALFFFKKLAIG